MKKNKRLGLVILPKDPSDSDIEKFAEFLNSGEKTEPTNKKSVSKKQQGNSKKKVSSKKLND